MIKKLFEKKEAPWRLRHPAGSWEQWCKIASAEEVLPKPNSEHLMILEKGVIEWNKWREQNANIKPDLKGAFLSNCGGPQKLDNVLSSGSHPKRSFL
jgi:hypothetical protein